MFVLNEISNMIILNSVYGDKQIKEQSPISYENTSGRLLRVKPQPLLLDKDPCSSCLEHLELCGCLPNETCGNA